MAVKSFFPKEGKSSVEKYELDLDKHTISVKFRRAKSAFIHQLPADRAEAIFDAAAKYHSPGEYFHRFIRPFPKA